MNETVFWSEVVCVGLRVYHVNEFGTIEIGTVVAYDEEARTVNLVVFQDDGETPVVHRARVPYAPGPTNGARIPNTFHI